MSKLEQSWPQAAFDAISILAVRGQVEIDATDGDQVELECEFESHRARDVKLEPVERWLQLHMWSRGGDAEIKLRLPRKKAWVVDVSAAYGEVEVKGIQARLRVMLGKGEVKVEDCRGVINIASGKGEVEMKRCTQAEVPERPAMPQFDAQFQVPPMPQGAGAGGEFRFRMGRPPRPGRGSESPWDWLGFDGEDWAAWGSQFGEQARVWAQQFAGQFVGQVDWLPEKRGIGLRIGKGNVQLEEIEAQSCDIQLAAGDVELEDGRIADLEMSLSHGGIECESVLPTGNWEIEVRHGDIQLSLPSNTQARLDVATRHGDIESEVPLVRVGRPGPEARHGGRMVGTVGQAEGKGAQISLTAQSGDIRIEWEHGASKYSNRPTTGDVRVDVDVPVDANVPAPQATAPAPASAVEASRASAETTMAEATTARENAAPAKPSYDSHLAILQALSEGKISVKEAERLLHSLER